MDDSGLPRPGRAGAATPSPGGVYLDYRQLCRQTGISISTLRRLVKAGRLPFFQPGGRRARIVFPPDVIERLLTPPTAPGPTPAVSPPAQARRGPQPKWRRGV